MTQTPEEAIKIMRELVDYLFKEIPTHKAYFMKPLSTLESALDNVMPAAPKGWSLYVGKNIWEEKYHAYISDDDEKGERRNIFHGYGPTIRTACQSAINAIKEG